MHEYNVFAFWAGSLRNCTRAKMIIYTTKWSFDQHNSLCSGKPTHNRDRHTHILKKRRSLCIAPAVERVGVGVVSSRLPAKIACQPSTILHVCVFVCIFATLQKRYSAHATHRRCQEPTRTKTYNRVLTAISCCTRHIWTRFTDTSNHTHVRVDGNKDSYHNKSNFPIKFLIKTRLCWRTQFAKRLVQCFGIFNTVHYI